MARNMLFVTFYKSVTDRPTDGRTNHGQMDTPSYRDARTHLKNYYFGPIKVHLTFLLKNYKNKYFIYNLYPF